MGKVSPEESEHVMHSSVGTNISKVFNNLGNYGVHPSSTPSTVYVCAGWKVHVLESEYLSDEKTAAIKCFLLFSCVLSKN